MTVKDTVVGSISVSVNRSSRFGVCRPHGVNVPVRTSSQRKLTVPEPPVAEHE